MIFASDRMKKTNHFRKFMYGAVIFAASFLLLFLSRQNRELSEWYATHVYNRIVSIVGKVTGGFPFSVVEMLLYLVLLILSIGAIWIVIAVFLQKIRKEHLEEHCKGRRKESWKEQCKGMLVNFWLFAAVLFLLYTLNCGINYQRKTFSELEGLQISAYSAEELKRVCQMLTDDVNTYADDMKRDAQGVMILDGNERAYAAEAMEKLGETYPEFAGEYPLPKPLAGSWILSIQNLTGIYSPFTVEANYNKDMTDYNIPFTMCHELSHLRGFMEEKEANFIAYLACMESDQAEFRYSGSLLGWIYCTNVLYKVDYDAYQEIRAELSDEALNDLRANREFWAAYDGTVARVSESINDGYLKANGQEEGVEGYDRMVDLMVAYLLSCD